MGFFITFEGLDGSGKSTQLRLLARILRERGLPVTETRQPGGTALGDRLRAVLVEAQAGPAIAPISKPAELAMLFADRAQAVAEIVAPALERGDAVICDRWTDSTEAYQGGGRGLDPALIGRLHRELCAGLQPDLTLLLLPPLAVALGRARRRNARALERTGREESRFEAEADAFFERVHAAYLALAAREPVRVVVIDGDAPVEAVHARIVQVVERRLAAAGASLPL